MFFEKITNTELDKMTLENGTTPNYIYERYDQETKTYINLEIKKTAEEVYQEWLNNKNNPPKKEPTETEILQRQLLETQNMLLELQYKLTNKDLTNNLK
ncbi:hypothetical protein FC764_04130 [Clostridium botulinum]|nr:hypothetical protein [Clostridium botulinum]